MASMSYCLFENTASDLSRAAEKLDDGAHGSPDWSREEARAAVRLVRLARQIAQDWDVQDVEALAAECA